MQGYTTNLTTYPVLKLVLYENTTKQNNTEKPCKTCLFPPISLFFSLPLRCRVSDGVGKPYLLNTWHLDASTEYTMKGRENLKVGKI